MSDEPSLLEIKKLIEDLAEIIDVLHVEMTSIKEDFASIKKNFQEMQVKAINSDLDYMHG
tara:strand:- start:2871 stop:3050 length:180 start_codon:yes stop_codon:yes gene_type:complete